MTTKADFTPEEWAALRRGIVAGEEAIRAVAPAGWYGRLQESRALKREWKTILERYGDTALAHDLVGAKGEAPIENVKLEPGEAGPFIDASVEACKAAAGILKAKVDPGDAESYVEVAMGLAEAAFLANPGRKSDDPHVGRAERVVLHRVADAFGVKDYTPPGTDVPDDTLQTDRGLQSYQQYE